MSLYERWAGQEGFEKLSIHTFFSYLHLWLHNCEGLGATAGSRAVANLNLSASDQTEANAIKTKFDALGTVAAKAEFVDRIHAVATLSEAGQITKAEAKTLLGF